MTRRHDQLPAESGTPLKESSDVHDQRNYFYPAVPILQKPPTARVSDAKHFSGDQRTEGTRVQGSISSASVSSGRSNKKHQRPASGSQWPSPSRERTLVSENRPHPSQSTQWQVSGSARSGHGCMRAGKSEHASPVQAYIRGRRQMEEHEDDEEEEEHAIWVLFWLSALDPLHSLASCLFTIIITVGLLLASPLRLVHKYSSLGDQIIRALAPIFRHHLDMMYAPSVDHAFEWAFQPTKLICIQIVAPLISVGVAIAAWVTAAFWVFTSIMGNPDGTERRDDGRDAVLAIRNWWERCLLKAMKPRVKPAMSSVV